MKKTLFLYITIFGFTLSKGLSQIRCGTAEYQQWQRTRYLNSAVQNIIGEKQRTEGVTTISGIVYIPVVFHVVHNRADNVIGGTNNPNISDEQIQSQITVLNEDYRRKAGTLGFNNSPVGADVEIEFCLATTDPNCFPTNGITRHYTTTGGFHIFDDDSLVKSFGPWPNTDYLNIWVCSLTGGYLGYTQFPNGSSQPGLLDFYKSASTDGIVVNFREVGRKLGTAPGKYYNLGRTITHEAGHWLGLIHTWGDDHCGNDYCDDTPPAYWYNLAVNCDDVYSNCVNGFRTRNMIENYLDYSPDTCMNIFTQDQKSRMRATLANAPDRIKILSSNGCMQTTSVSIPLNRTFESGIIADSGWYTGSSDSQKWITAPDGGYGLSKTSIFLQNEGGLGQLISPIVNFNGSSNPVLLFDLAYPNSDVADTLTILAYTGCKTGYTTIRSFFRKDLSTYIDNPVNKLPDATDWNTLMVSLKDIVSFGYASIVLQSSSKSGKKLYVDNIKIVNWSDNPVTIYPNPSIISTTASFNDADKRIQVEPLFTGNANVTFVVYNLTGQNAYSETHLNTVSKLFSLNHLPLSSGMYIIKTLVNDQLSVNKVIVF